MFGYPSKTANLGMLGIIGGMAYYSSAQAHPFSQEEYSLRTAVTISDKGVVPLVVLEIPIPIALREIGATTDDPTEVKKRKITSYNKLQWDTLSSNLVFTIDGQHVEGQWLSIDHPANGKATEGFFVYMVSFQYAKPVAIHNDSKIVIEDKAYPEAKMVYSGSVTAKEPWVVVSSTSQQILQEYETADLSEPKRWSKDPALRNMEIVVRTGQ